LGRIGNLYTVFGSMERLEKGRKVNGKIGERKESEWKEQLSTVWNHVREERKKNYCGPHAKNLSVQL
jgi:hypothetical protein